MNYRYSQVIECQELCTNVSDIHHILNLESTPFLKNNIIMHFIVNCPRNSKIGLKFK